MCLNLLSCYIFKLSLYFIGFVVSPGQVERKLSLTELYCSHFSFINIFTGLIVHKTCNKILTLCCENMLRSLH
uniref:Uncharacterized protein n=1 Tax=Castor canadensis TaxID=51338 RepID=A0A8C0WEE8_CASCN